MRDWKLRETSDQRFPVLSSRYGLCAMLLMQTGGAGTPILSLYNRVFTPIRLDQIIILYHSDGSPAAYATWAFVSDQTLVMIGDGKQRWLHASEWNDGTNLVVMDIVAKPELAFSIAVRLKRMFSRVLNPVYAVRTDRADRVSLRKLRSA